MQLAQAQDFAQEKDEQAGDVAHSSPTEDKGIPEVLIRGRRSSNTDIQRTEEDIQPYVVFDADAIERSGASNLEEFLKTRLTMNTVQGTYAQQVGSLFGNQSQVNLRGLGTSQTLILVNGRRMPNISAFSLSTTGFGQPDINGIPLATVERIEVLPSTASGIYGGGATGGVLNIVLKRDYSGAELKGTFNNTFDSDLAQRKLDASAGFSLQEGRTSIQIAASYSDANRLLDGDRDFTDRSQALQLRNNPVALLDPFFPPRGRTPNITNATGGPLVFAGSGISLNSPITYVPEGYAGVHTDGGAALAQNAGQYNLEQAEDLFGRRMSLLNDPIVESLSLNVRREFSESVEVFVDLALYENKSRALTAGLPVVVTLEPGVPNNPFTGPIMVNFPSTGLELDARSDSKTRQAAGGLIVRLPHRWSAQGEYSWSRSRFESVYFNPAINTEGLAALEDGTLDIVRDLNLHPIDYTPYLLEIPGSVFGPADTILQTVNLRFAGPTLALPAGPLTLTAQVEYREEEAKDFIRITNFTGGPVPTYTYQPPRSQKVHSGYVEATVPLISAANARTAARELQLQLSVRRDEYETTIPATSGVVVPSPDAPVPALDRITNKVASTDFTAGLRWSPSENLALRASFGTGFLPPSIAQLFPSVTPSGAIFAADPKRSGVLGGIFPVHITRGGNPELTPEESESWSAGLIFTPSVIESLRVSVDYTRIRKTDEITNFLFQEILDNEDYLPGRVTRAELTQADIDAGYTGGVIIAINSTAANIASTELEAFDVQIDYGWNTPWGHFSAYTMATYQPHLRRQVLPTSRVVDRAGFMDGLVKWRANMGLSLERGGWTFGWNAQYYHAYKVYDSFIPETSIPDVVLNQGSSIIPSQTYHDVYGRYRFDRPMRGFAGGLLADAEIMFGIQNVLNDSPPIIASAISDSGYSLYGDPRLRRYSLSFVRKF